METNRMASFDDARRALRDVDDSRRSIARRLPAPWWYRVGAASCAAALLVGVGLVTAAEGEHEASGLLLTTAVAALWPMVLLTALKRATGISIDRYASGMTAWYIVMFGLFAVALAVQVLANVALLFPAAGVVAFVATWINERHLDVRLRERVQAGTAAV